MIHWPQVLASRLHQRKFVLDKGLPCVGSLFPFFDCEGVAEHALLVIEGASELLTIELETASLSIPIWGAIRISGPIDRLGDRSLDAFALTRHYDPWWTLTDERFESERSISLLKQTNCVNEFEAKPMDLVYSSSLSRVTKVRFPMPSENYRSQKFSAETLPAKTIAVSPKQSPDQFEWQLSPFWSAN